jgi:hypothetical protein
VIDAELLARARAVLAGKPKSYVEDARAFAAELIRLAGLEANRLAEPNPLDVIHGPPEISPLGDAIRKEVFRDSPLFIRVTETAFAKPTLP